MYLTRTKLLAAGLVLVGILTTSVSVLSKADAQGPPGDANAERVRKYYDALRSHDAVRDRWEYRFIAVEKPLTTGELQTVLGQADRDGWTYCGSQELAAEKTGKISPHMVFKRLRAGALTGAAAAASLAETVERERAAAALAELAAREGATDRAAVLERERAALLDLLKRRDNAIGERKAEADYARRMAEEQEARARDEAVEARRREALLEHDRALAEKARQDAVRARDEANSRAASDKDRQKQVEDMKAKYESIIQALQAELKAKSVTPPTKADPGKKTPEPQASAANPFSSTARTPGPDDSITAAVELKHMDGKLAVFMLGKAMPDAKVVAEVGPNRIVLSGPAKTVIEARDFIRSRIDLPEHATKTGGDDKPDTAIIRLTNITAADAVKIVQKVIGSRGGVRLAADESTNSLFVSGPPAVLADIKKLIGEADKPTGPAK
jgi:type II secretory pathway component GspD/PulD (secretin)